MSPYFPPASTATAGLQVVHFDGIGQHVNHGIFWKVAQSLGTAFRWEAWIKPDSFDSSTYIVSDGYGGAHALLWSGTSGIVYTKGANNAYGPVAFSAIDAPPPDVFSHVLVALVAGPYDDPDGVPHYDKWIVVYINGICVGKVPFIAGAGQTDPIARAVSAGSDGQGVLFVGGSDHSMYPGYIAMMRAFDTVQAVDFGIGQAFCPQRVFSNSGPSSAIADFNCSYIGPGGIYADLSDGYDCNAGFTRRTKHPGKAFNTTDAGRESEGYASRASEIPVPGPLYVVNAPFDPAYVPAAPSRGYTPKAVPALAKIFDSFSRADQTFAHTNVPSMGSTEGGSLGVKPWVAAFPLAGTALQTSKVGIFNRSPVALDVYDTWAYVQTSSADLTVSATRRTQIGSTSDGRIGLCFRVHDAINGWYAYHHRLVRADGTTVDAAIYVYIVEAGVATYVGGSGIAADLAFDVLKVVTLANNIKVYTDATLQVNITDARFNTDLGVGIYWGNDCSPGPSSLQRTYDFTVL